PVEPVPPLVLEGHGIEHELEVIRRNVVDVLLDDDPANDSDQRVACGLKEPLVVPVWMALCYQPAQPVVLPEAQRVEHDESDVDVAAIDAGRKERGLALRRLVT